MVALITSKCATHLLSFDNVQQKYCPCQLRCRHPTTFTPCVLLIRWMVAKNAIKGQIATCSLFTLVTPSIDSSPELCMSMQDMSDCKAWKGYCNEIPDWGLCSFESNRDALPPMRMYFHTGIMDIILFREWVPRNQLGYFGSWVAIFFMEFFFEIFKALRALLERRWNKSLVRDLQKRAKGKTNGNDTEKGKDCCNDDCKPDANGDEDDVTIEPVFEM